VDYDAFDPRHSGSATAWHIDRPPAHPCCWTPIRRCTLAATVAPEGLDPRLINQLESRVREIVDALLDGVAQQGRCDFHDVVSASVPTTVIAEFIGVPSSDRHLFKAWSDARVAATGGMPGHESDEAVATTALEMYLVAHGVVRGRQPRPGTVGEPE